MKERTYLFDASTLCDNKQIDKDFKEFFIDWSKDKDYFIITSMEKSEVYYKLGPEIIENSNMSFFCMGNSIYMDTQDFNINRIILHKDEIEFLEERVEHSTFNFKLGNHIKYQNGCVNFSVIGNEPSAKLIKFYQAHDKRNQERAIIVRDLCKKFPRLEAYINGKYSIAICLRGANFLHTWRFIGRSNNNVYFFSNAEDLEPTYINYPFLQCAYPDHVVSIENGYKELWEKLKEL